MAKAYAEGYAKDQPSGFSNRIERVTIVGAGGKVGRHVTEALLKTGKHDITAITRPESTSQLPKGVKVLKIDYSGSDQAPSPELVDALRGQHVLVITMAIVAGQDATSKFIKAAAAAGVPYVLPNYFGPDPLNDELCQATLLARRRDAIYDEFKQLGVSAYLLLASNFWYEFSLGGGPNRYGFDFVNKSLIWFDQGDELFNTTTWPQSGRAVANLLSLKVLPDDERDQAPTLSRFANGPVYVSSFRLSQRDMFDSVKRVTKTTDADWTITHESAQTRWAEAKEAVQNGDLSIFTKMLYSRIFIKGGGGDFEAKRGSHNDLLGLPVEDLDEATAEGIRLGENGEVPFGH